jgi:hypothetical protein
MESSSNQMLSGARRWMLVAAGACAAAGSWSLLTGRDSFRVNGVLSVPERVLVEVRAAECTRCVARAQQRVATLAALPRSGKIELIGQGKAWPLRTKHVVAEFSSAGMPDQSDTDGDTTSGSLPQVRMYGNTPSTDFDLVDQARSIPPARLWSLLTPALAPSRCLPGWVVRPAGPAGPRAVHREPGLRALHGRFWRGREGAWRGGFDA